jgi:uridine kinase
MTLEQIAATIVSLSLSHPVRVGIDGITASGKTTFADELGGVVAKRGRSIIRASVDDFHRPPTERYVKGRLSPEGYYSDAFDYPQLQERLLLPLGPSGSRHYATKVHDQDADSPIENPVVQIASEDAVLIVDGVFLFRPELFDLWDFRIFLDVDPGVARERGILRDQHWIGSLEQARQRYEQRYVPGERLYLREVEPQNLADVVIENTDPQRRMFRFQQPARMR